MERNKLGRFVKGERVSEKTEFKKGNIPWNKWMKGYSNKKGNYHENSGFQKGHKNYNEKGHRWSEESRINKSAKLQGIEVSEWTDFKSELNRRLRNSSKWKVWRELVFLRDNFTCQNKNCKFCNNKMGVILHPHHIKQVKDYPELIFNVENGITYCAEFHLKSNLHKKIKQVNLIGGD